MTSPARSGIRRLTRLGNSTFSNAIAPPATTVPGNSSAAGLTLRSSKPAASRTTAMPRTRSSPNRRLSGAPAPEKTPKHSTGIAASSDRVAADRCSADSSSGKIGGRLVTAARMLMPSKITPPISSAAPGPDRSSPAGPGLPVPSLPVPSLPVISLPVPSLGGRSRAGSADSLLFTRVLRSRLRLAYPADAIVGAA